MRTRPGSVLIGLPLAGLVAAGCVSLKRTPEARFFVLRSVVEPPAPLSSPDAPAPATAPGGLVGVLPVLLPGYLDRAQIVTWTGPGELRIDEFLRWAEPLDAGIVRVLAENLGAALPSHRVIRAPWSSKAPLRCRVRLEVARFGPREGGDLVLAGRFALLPRDRERPYLARAVDLRRPLGAGTDAAAGVEAMSVLLADLSREVAAAILDLPPEASKAEAVR